MSSEPVQGQREGGARAREAPAPESRRRDRDLLRDQTHSGFGAGSEILGKPPPPILNAGVLTGRLYFSLPVILLPMERSLWKRGGKKKE